MSYSGTVHCSYCGKKGHNRLGCPEREKNAISDPESYDAKKWRAERERLKARVASRKCSYCKQGTIDGKGHNRKGCPVLKEDRKLVETRQIEYIEQFRTALQETGLSVGALVTVPDGNSYDDAGIWGRGFTSMVTSIDWSNIDFLMNDTKLLRDWRASSRNLLQTRVISSFGYCADDDDWRRSGRPNFNEVRPLTVSNLLSLMPSVFHELATNQDGHNVESRPIRLESPSHISPSSPSSDAEIINAPLNRAFQFVPMRRADSWEKVRRGMSDDIWSRVRPLEHADATAH